MSATLLAPKSEAKTQRERTTVADFYRLMNLGMMDYRFEVIDGEAIKKVSHNPPHYFCLKRLERWANAHFGDAFVRTQGPITIPGPEGIFTEPEPDIAITTNEETSYATRHPASDDLLLVAEVADSSLQVDLIDKARLYARARIVEYWVLDVNNRKVHVHRNPIEGVYTLISVHADGDNVFLLSHPKALVAVSNLMPPLNA